ncbi:hypothetical protein [Clostridium tagluense]|uniref:hypothetical protein n=1 Tax=Clostridium tagluense TaxID=360422 RepID=UPI001CF21E94|nr:hypothetical protein [Clostridium tagluense]MCB2300242.1 hypothetical protein [Clostridium tagluense]
MREDNEIFRDFVKEKKDTMDLIFSKIKEALKSLDTIENNEECDRAKLILCQCLILTKLTVMNKEETDYLNDI